jgi:cobalamin-dependent methionine synthase I
VGDPVTFTANVSGISGLAVPTGSVTFKQGAQILGTVPLVNGEATFTETYTKTGKHTVVAHYSGDQNYYKNASKAVKQVVEN